MIAALYSARCTLTSEIEVKDNGSGNWLINPREAKGCLSNAASSCMLFKWSAKKKKKRKPDAFLQKGVSDRRAKGLNLPCQAPKNMSSQLRLQRQSHGLAARSEGTPHRIITLTSDSFHRDEIVYYRHICMAGSTERQGAHNKAICICSARASLSAPPRSFCLTCITATELPVGAGGVGGGREGPRGAQERGRGVSQSQRMTSGAAANLGFE